jgi:hypothetical protein
MVRSTLVAPALASVLLASSCLAEIRQFDDVFKAASSVIHYSEGYVTAPGFVDLNDLVFSTADDFRNTEYDDQYFDDDSDKDDTAKETAKPSPAPTGPPTKSPTKPPTNLPTLAPTEKPVTETDATEDGDGDGDERALDPQPRGSQVSLYIMNEHCDRLVLCSKRTLTNYFYLSRDLLPHRLILFSFSR